MRPLHYLLAVAMLIASATMRSGRVLLFLGQERGHLAAGAEGVHHLEPDEKVETFTVQPKFEGNALDFGMVIPTPTQPKLHEMPRDFFKHLAVYTIMRKREFAALEAAAADRAADDASRLGAMLANRRARCRCGDDAADPTQPAIKILEAGVVGSLDYKIIEAGRADDLFQWLKDNKYSYSGDEATLNHYIQKKWLFTVMKIDTMQMKTQQGRHLRRRSHADALPVRQREARLSAEDHADLGDAKRPKRCSTCRRRTRSICRAT